MLKVLIDPNSFFEEKDDVSMVLAFLIVLISALLGILLIYSNLNVIERHMLETFRNVPPEKAKAFFEVFKYYLLISPLIGSIIGWVIMSGVIHVLSSLLGGEGEFSKTMKIVALGYLPSIVLFPVNYAIVSMTHELKGTPLFIVGVAMTIWQFAILTFGMKHWRNMSTERAAISVAIPLIVFTGFGIIGRLLKPT